AGVELGAVGGALLAAASGARAADEAVGFPARPIRMVIGFSPGGVVDVSVRIIGQKLGDIWKQQVIADNRPGAGGVIAAQIAAGANADGYTLLSLSASHVIAPALSAEMAYGPPKQFSRAAMTVI